MFNCLWIIFTVCMSKLDTFLNKNKIDFLQNLILKSFNQYLINEQNWKDLVYKITLLIELPQSLICIKIQKLL